VDGRSFPQRAFAPLGRLLDFGGRSPRAEFWPYMGLLLALYVAGFALVAAFDLRMTYVFGLVGALVLLAFAAVVRRLHDVGWRGWWMGAYVLYVVGWMILVFYSRYRALHGEEGLALRFAPVLMPLALVQTLLAILVFVLCTLDGTPGPNRYGPDPKGRAGA
jgi:uncharacterized membrane protein YhaH (DUF805 family)